MAIQPTRPEAYDTGTLNQYAHIYDVQAEEKRARIAEETEEAARIAADDAEKQARIEADDAEKQARIAADDTEKQARIAADDALGKRIDAAEVEQMTPVKLTDDDKTASRQPVASGTRSLAFGPGAKATANQSVALGAFSQTSSRGNTVSVGSDTLKRRIENVEAGQMDNDVVIMSQLANVGGIPDLWFADSWDALITLSTTDNTLTTDASKIIANADDGVYKLRPAVSFAYSEVESEFAESPINNTGSGSNAILFINSINIGNKSYKLMYFSTRSGGYKINEPNALSTMEWFYVLIDMTVNLPTGKIVRYAPHLTGNTPIKVNYDKTAISLSLSLDTTRGGIDISDNGLYATTATQAVKGIVQGSDSIVITDGIAKVNPSIFGDGLATTDGKVYVDTGFVGEHLAGDALYYDSTNGLMVKTGTGLHIDNDTLSVDQDTLPLASADNRGTVKVGSGLAIAKDGTLSVDQNTLPLASAGNRGTVKVGSGLAIAKDGTLSANVTTMEYRKASNENITCDGMTLTDYVYLANTSYPKYDVTYYGQATKAFASGTKVTVDIATNTDTFNSYGCVEMSVNGLTLAIDSVSLDENGDRLKQAVFSVSKAIGIGDYVRFKLYF